MFANRYWHRTHRRDSSPGLARGKCHQYATPALEDAIALLPGSKGTISFDETEPVGVHPGEQTVAVYGHEQLEPLDRNDVFIENIVHSVYLPVRESQG